MGNDVIMCIHEIPQLSCGFCKPRKKKSNWGREGRFVPTSGDRVLPNKEAMFDSRCPGCSEKIEEGDVITLCNGEWVCEDCVIDWEILEKRKAARNGP